MAPSRARKSCQSARFECRWRGWKILHKLRPRGIAIAPSARDLVWCGGDPTTAASLGPLVSSLCDCERALDRGGPSWTPQRRLLYFQSGFSLRFLEGGYIALPKHPVLVNPLSETKMSSRSRSCSVIQGSFRPRYLSSRQVRPSLNHDVKTLLGVQRRASTSGFDATPP